MNAEQRLKIEALYLELFDKMKIYACCSLKNETLAEEVVQETFRIACQKPEQVCGSVNPQGWLVQTLKYTIQNYRKNHETAKKILEKYLETQERDISLSEDHMQMRVLYKNVADTEEFRLLSELVIEGRSHLEMAKSRGISVDACKKRVQRAKEILRRRIKI